MNKDIFDSMIGMGLDMVILEILTMLDSQSIANARLTCHKWRNEIDQLLWHTETGKKYLYILNKNNFIHNEPIVTTKQLNSDAFDLKYDDKDIVVGTNNGKVICFNTDTLELRWEQQNIGDSIQLAFNDYAIFTGPSK
jgi:outer membrane protein assembly factor BamB